MYDNEVAEGVCVCCGAYAGPLLRQYSPVVLKLTHCAKCGRIADKYLEYDPVIIMVDLILLSKEAYRHVLYNTPFKAFWKLFLAILIMDTYVQWSKDITKVQFDPKPKHTITLSENKSYVHILNTSYTLMHYNFNEEHKYQHENFDEWKENEFSFAFTVHIYLTFLKCLIAVSIFYIIGYVFTIFLGYSTLLKDKVSFLLFSKAFTLANSGNLFLLPALIWGSDHDGSIHIFLVFGYTFLALTSVHSIIFQCHPMKSFMILLISYTIKFSIASNINRIKIS